MGLFDVQLLAGSPVFADIPVEEREGLIDSLGAEVRRYDKGCALRRVGDTLEFYPVILSGSVQATMPQGGQNRIVAQFGAGDAFAEAVPATLKRCPVDIWALEDTCILCLPSDRLDACGNPFAKTLCRNLRTELSKKIQVLSRTLAMLSEPRLSDRILAYLDTLPRNVDGSVTVPYSRHDWAGYLRVADKSLIRELRALQNCGVLEVNGRNVKVRRDPRC